MDFSFHSLAIRLRPWGIVLGGFLLIFGFVLLMARLIHDPLDRVILLACNPDHYVPVIDELMILITDFSVFVFSVLFISWEVAYLICRGRPHRRWWVSRALLVLGVLSGLYYATGVFRAQYEYTIIFLPLGMIFLAGYCYLGWTFAHWDEKALRRGSLVFRLTLLSVFLTNAIGEDSIKKIVGRPRPLAGLNEDWNAPIRRIPDEIVRGGYSYVSGHASSLFALTTPMALATSNPWIRGAIFTWAAVHAYTRVYTAAHYPYCALMGSVLGFAIGALVFAAFRDRRAAPDNGAQNRSGGAP